MRLTSKELYERKYIIEGEDILKCPVFYLKKLSVAEKTAIDDASFKATNEGMNFLTGTWSRLKLRYSLVKWENVTDTNDVIAECTEENKDKLPTEVYLWLITEIDKLNGIGKVVTEEERKNS